jgi:hypothetical protein
MSKFRCSFIELTKSITVLLRDVGVGLVVQYLLSKSVTCLKTSASKTTITVLLLNTTITNALFKYRRCFSLGFFSCWGRMWFLVTILSACYLLPYCQHVTCYHTVSMFLVTILSACYLLPYCQHVTCYHTVSMLLELFRCRFYVVAMCIILALCGLFGGGRLSNKHMC